MTTELDIMDYEIRQQAEKLLGQFLALIRLNQDAEFQTAVKDLMEFTVEHTSRTNVSERPAPFFSESCLYELLGKDDARTLLALMRPIWVAAGYERSEQP